jgi:hypothetical protein
MRDGEVTTMFDAAAVIGRGRSDDYLLSPIEHADRLRASAPKLAALLTHSAPMELAQQYADADAEAVAAEATFKRWLTRANWTVLVTATVSAVLMAVVLLEGTLGGLTKPLLAVLALLGVGTGAIASMGAVPGEGGTAAGGLVDGARAS